MPAIRSVDDLPPDAIRSIGFLHEIFRGTVFEPLINGEFLRNYNEAKEAPGNLK